MPLDQSCEATTLARSADVDDLSISEDIHHHLVAGIGRVVSRNSRLSKNASGRGAVGGLLEVPGHRLIHALRFHKLDKTELHRVVAVLSDGLLLHDNAWARLNDCDRNDGPV